MRLDNAIAKSYLTIPRHIVTYLIEERGLTPAIILRYWLGWNGRRIMIPIFNQQGRLVFFKQARAPGDSHDAPKMVCWPTGEPTELFGWENLTQLRPQYLVICEGEFDRMVLESRGIAAVTGTAGANVFLKSWADALAPLPNLFVCYDRDEAGRTGALRIGRLLPHARIVELPEEVGPGGDVTDFFVRIGRTVHDFYGLLRRAAPLPAAVDDPEAVIAEAVHEKQASRETPTRPVDPRILRVKADVPLEQIVRRHTQSLRRSGRTLIGHCPFHPDRHPSFVLYIEQQRYHCYGCERRGDVIQFIMDAEHLSFPDALRALEREGRLP